MREDMKGEDDEKNRLRRKREKVKRRIKLFSCGAMRGETKITAHRREEDEKRTDERWKSRDDR